MMVRQWIVVVGLGVTLGCPGDSTGDSGDTGGGSGDSSTGAADDMPADGSETGGPAGSTDGGPADTGSGSDDGSTGETGASSGVDSSGDGSGDSSGGETTGGVAEPGDANDVQWPAPCAGIAAEAHVCLSVGNQFDEETAIVAISLESGATCTVQSLGFTEFFDLPPAISWVGQAVTWSGGFEESGVVVDLGTGDMTDIAFSDSRFFDWGEGVLVDVASSKNYPYFETIDDLIAGTPAETYALTFLGSRGFTAGDSLHTYNFDGTSDGSVDILTGANVPPVVLAGFDGGIDGMAQVGDAVAVLSNEVIYVHDLATGAEIDSQPVAHESLRGLACSPGVTD